MIGKDPLGGGVTRPQILFTHGFENIISVENLLEAWREFLKGKRGRRDVEEFSLCLMDNILSLHCDLVKHVYRHDTYYAFTINDPKPRDIHKASVRDRLLHHAICRKLYPFFDKMFIADSFSCRKRKGTHKALRRFRAFGYKVSKNNTKTCWILKGDIRKFFENIDHKILTGILEKYIHDSDILWLLRNIIESFHSRREGIGLPLGNVTSQLLVNIYMNEFDWFVKHKLKARYYIRYADDFVVFSENRQLLEGFVPHIKNFLQERLRLELHPDKLFIKTLTSGVDFLERMFRAISTKRGNKETISSYAGLLKHGNVKKLLQKVTDMVNSQV